MASPAPGQTPPSIASSGAIGGAANEDGADFRASVAAWAVSFGLAGRALPCIDLPSAIPVSVSFETDNSVDDIEIGLRDGGRVFVQCKLGIHVGEADEELCSVVAQWCRALQNDEVDSERDRLLLAVKRSTAPLRALSDGLKRAKASIAGPPNRKEADSLRTIDVHSAKLGFPYEDRLRKVALVHSFPTDISLEAVSVIAGGVIPNPETAEDAWTALKDMARDLARNRLGLTIREWADRLNRRNIQFTCSANGGPAAQFEATRRALRSYRDRLVSMAGKMDLRGLGAPLPMFDHDPQKVKPRVNESDTADSGGAPLARAFQRLGRILLLGLPGGGKTTALTHLAATLANSEDSALPVVVSVIEWWRLLERCSPLDALIELAIRDVPLSDRSLLQREIRRRAECGELAVLLDGLDETRERRFSASVKVDELQTGVHSDVDFVLTTRDSGYSAARTLPFRAVKLMPPDNLEYTVGRIIAVAAGHYAAKITDRQAWEKQRTSWVADQIERDGRLRETPLIQVLLAVLAGDPDRDRLPENRAQVLNAVVDGLLDRWEIGQRRCGNIRLGTLEGTAAVEALRGSFAQIGFSLLRSGTSARAELTSVLGRWLTSHWGLAPGPAESTANEVLHFWDECGVFVFSGCEPIVQPRIPILAETGAARYLVSLHPAGQRATIAELETEPTASEAITLAALLSPTICEIAVTNAVSSQLFDMQILAYQRLLHGGVVSNDTANSLASGLSKFTSDSENAWAAANAIARMPVSHDSKVHRLERFATILSGRQYRLVLAGASSYSGMLVSEPERVLSDACEEMRPRLNAPTKVWNYRPNPEIQELVSRMADTILPERPDLAEAFSEAGNLGNMDLRERVDKALLKVQRADIVHQRFGSLVSGFRTWLEEGHQAWCDLLRVVAAQTVPRRLNVVERRRLDDLADFIRALGFGRTLVCELEFALRTAGEGLRALINSCTLLGGFDAAAVAAESVVALAMEEKTHDSMAFLFFAAERRPTTGWDRVDDKLQLIKQLVRLLGSTHWIARVAAEALSSCPLVQQVVSGIDEEFETWHPFNRLVAGELVMRFDPLRRERAHSWKAANDPIARQLAARTLAEDDDTPLNELLNWTLTDRDAWVRTTAIDALSVGRLSEPAILRIREVAATQPPSWLCIWCDNTSVAGTTSCSHCRTSGPNLASSVRKLLADIASGPRPISEG